MTYSTMLRTRRKALTVARGDKVCLLVKYDVFPHFLCHEAVDKGDRYEVCAGLSFPYHSSTIIRRLNRDQFTKAIALYNDSLRDRKRMLDKLDEKVKEGLRRI